MKSWSLLFVLLYCSGALCAPSDPTSTIVKNADKNGSKETSAEDSVPLNMNIADYYYSIFGKHLDYDYREPILTFDEPAQNELSEEIESEVDKGPDPWDTHSRKKRFIIVPSSVFNSTRRWVQQMRRLRLERRRLRTERRRQWQQNRIRYLNSRSEALQKQAARLTQLQQRQQVTRSVPEGQKTVTVRNVLKIEIPTTTSSTTTTSSSTSTGPPLHTNGIDDEKSKTIPVKQVPLPSNK